MESKSIKSEENNTEQKSNRKEKFKKVIKIADRALIGSTIVTSIGAIGAQLHHKMQAEAYNEGHENITSIVIANGEVCIEKNTIKPNYISNDDIHLAFNSKYYHSEINDVEYEVSLNNGHALVIYMYCNNDDDETKLKSVQDYFISNIQIDENNIVYFNEDDITEEGYYSYMDSVILNNNQEVRRVRTKEN